MRTKEEIWDSICKQDERNLFPMRIEKPWGYYVVHMETEDKSVCIKTLVIDPGAQLSIQYHSKRSEFWYISDDDARYEIILDKRKYFANGKYEIRIPVNSVHSIRNIAETPLVIHETQYGICEENDIVRLHDPYESQR